MLEDIEILTNTYLDDSEGYWDDAGLRGVYLDIENTFYYIGLFEGMHFNMLLYCLLKKNGQITKGHVDFIYHLPLENDPIKYKKKEKFIRHIVKFMSYNCCHEYVHGYTYLTKSITIAILERMIYFLKLNQ